jgi:cytochrome c oxidase subunit II
LTRRTISLAALAALLLLACAAAPAQALEIAPPDPHSPNAEAIRSTYWVMLIVGLVLVVAINAALIAAVVRFRERRGREPVRFAAARGALRPVIGALALLAALVFVYGVVQASDARDVEPAGPEGLGAGQSAQVGIKGVPPAALTESEDSTSEGGQPETGAAPGQTSPLQIDATAQQWLWRFEYPGQEAPGQETFSYGELVVPVDTPVILNVTSTDVAHTWWVPALGGQVQALPGAVSQTWFKADEVGRYEGRSTIFSGTGYPVMRVWVRVVTAPEYTSYVERLGKELDQAQDFVNRLQERAASGAGSAAGSTSGSAPEGSGGEGSGGSE